MANLVSDKDCKEILKKYLKEEVYEIVTFKTKPFFLKNADSYALHFILEIHVNNAKNLKKHRFFIKKTLEEGTLKHKLVTSRKSFEKEELFYNSLLPELLSNVQSTASFGPELFLQKEKHLLILEDLTMKFFIRTKRAYPIFLERIHLSLTLSHLAKFHAFSLAIRKESLEKHFAQFENRNQSGHSLASEEDSPNENWFKASVKGLETLLVYGVLNDSEREKTTRKFAEYVQKCKNILNTKTNFFKVLCHGQLHTKNVLFKYEGLIPNQCIFVDFQQIIYFYPAYDVLLLIFQTTHQLFRQHYYTYLLKYYYEHLMQELNILKIKKDFKYEEFLETVRYVTPLVKLQAALYFQESTGSKEFHAKLEKRPKIFQKYFFQDKSDVSLELLRKDSNFRIIMNEVVNEIRELCNVSIIHREECYKILEDKLDTTIYELESYHINKVKEDENLYVLEIHVVSEAKDLSLKYNILHENGNWNILGEINNC